MSAIELSTPFYEKQYNMFNICSQSINAHLAVLVRNHNREKTAMAAFIDSFAMTTMWNRGTPRLKVCIGIIYLMDVL